MTTPYDKKAVKILADTHWNKGWRQSFSTSPADLAYAISKGVMFAPRRFPHDESIRRVRGLCAGITPEAVGGAFLCSLSTREPFLRSAMASYAIARYIPEHQRVQGLNKGVCDVCRGWAFPDDVGPEDVNVLNFERLKWGGVRHADYQYQIFDLEQFLLLDLDEPSPEDMKTMKDILDLVPTLHPNATVTDLEKALGGVLSSNRSERRVLIEALCYAGILGYPGYGHLLDDSVPPADRPYRDSDWCLPASYWRARDGVNEDRLKEYFPQLDADRSGVSPAKKGA